MFTMKDERIKITFIVVVLIILCLITYYFHKVLNIGIIFTHLFYIPIFLSAYWWKRWGLIVALFLSLFLVLTNHFLWDFASNVDDYLRALMFIIIGVVVMILSEKIEKTNEELRRSERALVDAEKLANLGQLAAGLAHELNNPLGVVLMYAHFLQDEASDKNILEDSQIVIEQAERCKKIVSDLLQFARKNRVVLKAENLYEITVHCLELMNLADNIDVNVECNCVDPIAEVDGDQIVQVITNMVNNAVDAMPEGGKLTVSVNGDENDVRLIIKDTGIGIPAYKINKIFEPFYSTKQIGKGTGLGLSVSHGIIKMHRGKITVESNANKDNAPTGTEFTVHIPRKGETDSPLIEQYDEPL
jgi:signal transduction histidine kinase